MLMMVATGAMQVPSITVMVWSAFTLVYVSTAPLGHPITTESTTMLLPRPKCAVKEFTMP